MVSLDKAVGSLLLGTYVNSCLFVVELFQMAHYFRHQNNDSRAMKTEVGIVATLNALDTVANISAVYLYAITHWGNSQYLEAQNWPIAAHFVATGFVGALVQGFMLFRFWRMTEHWLTVGILALFSLASFAASIGTAVETTMNVFFSKHDGGASVFVTVWLIGSLVADVGIATSLVWRLHRVKTDIQPAKSLIRRLITSAVSTGTSTSIIAIIAVFAYFHEPDSNVAISVTFILGRVYSCTMLYLLNNRSRMRGERADGTVEVGLATNFNLGGIYINRTAVVVRDLTMDTSSIAPPQESDIKDQPFSGLIDLNEPSTPRSSTSSAFSESTSSTLSGDDGDTPPEDT
ncbi:hypothetical protein C8R47DRAFT_1314487 [Mycena vitilis]|nr:hypothetical protein C8R47DRAFT_1314487 [Mycena vitilis]